MIACPKCAQPSPEGAAFCAHCGAALAGAGSALERMIDERAHAIVAAEKAADASARAERERGREEKRVRGARHRARGDGEPGRAARGYGGAARGDGRPSSLGAQVKAISDALAANRKEPSTLLGSCWGGIKLVAVWTFLFAIFPGTGLMVHVFLVPAIGHSPASVVCPYVCDGCEASARVLQWNFRGTWHSENGKMGYAFICENHSVDVSSLASFDVSNGKMNARLQPYMLSSFSVWMLEIGIVTPVVALTLGPIFGYRRWRKKLERATRLGAS